jgi:O-antigen/teichoic acid export membrane protein
MVSTFYSISTLGFYSLVNRVLGMPISLIGSSIGQVFYKQATVEKRATGKVIKSFKSTFKKLLLISIIPFGALFFTIENLFVLVFGENWTIAGEYAKALTPLFAIRFIVSPLSVTNQVNLKNNIGLVFNIILLVLTFNILMVSHIYRLEFINMIYIMTSAQSLFYLSFLWVVYKESSK